MHLLCILSYQFIIFSDFVELFAIRCFQMERNIGQAEVYISSSFLLFKRCFVFCSRLSFHHSFDLVFPLSVSRSLYTHFVHEMIVEPGTKASAGSQVDDHVSQFVLWTQDHTKNYTSFKSGLQFLHWAESRTELFWTKICRHSDKFSSSSPGTLIANLAETSVDEGNLSLKKCRCT